MNKQAIIVKDKIKKHKSEDKMQHTENKVWYTVGKETTSSYIEAWRLAREQGAEHFKAHMANGKVIQLKVN